MTDEVDDDPRQTFLDHATGSIREIDKQAASDARRARGSDGRFAAAVMEDDKSVDEALDRALRAMDPQPAKPDDPSGQTALEKNKAEESAKAAPTKVIDEKPKEAAKRDSKEYESALTSLRLLGVYDDADIEKMSEADVIRFGTKAKVRVDDFNQRLQRQAEAAKKPTAKLEGQPEPAKAEPTDGPIDEAQGLIDTYGEEFGRPVIDTIRKATDAVKAAHAQEIEGLRKEVQAMQFEKARDILRERFPEVDTESEQGAFIEKMHALAKTGAYSSIQSLARDAAQCCWGEKRVEEAAAKTQELRTKKKNGTALVSSREAAPKPRSFESRLDAALDAALDGKDGREVGEVFDAR